MSRQSYVYFMRDEDTQLIKIGYSKLLNKRQKAIAYLTKHTITLLGYLRGAKTVEKRLHKKFSNYRVKNEWFQPSDEILNFIAENTANEVIELPKRSKRKLKEVATHMVRVSPLTYALMETVRENYQPKGRKFTQNDLVDYGLKLLKRQLRRKDKQS